MEKNNQHKSILIAPLDWGLGHATRCIPIIQYFLQKDWKVIIACPNGSSHHTLLSKEFPDATFVPLFGYDVRYAKSRAFFMPKMFLQLPKIHLTIKREKKWLENFVKEMSVDLIFSDNRYGLSHTRIPCVFMTHQLELILPTHFQQRIAQKINYRYIDRFDQCWIPDFEKNGIAGSLSHPKKLPNTDVRYIGPLSRLGKKTESENLYKFLIVLSGPEPQRTILEEKLLAIAALLPGKTLIVRGTPNQSSTPSVSDNCVIVNHLNNEEMRNAFAHSEYILSRSGYTTVMEILSWQKKSILIPTPGQSEQEYLGKELIRQKYAYSFPQETTDYLKAINDALSFQYDFPDYTAKTYVEAMEKALADLGF